MVAAAGKQAAFDHADTARLGEQLAQSEREALQPSLQSSSCNGHINLFCATPSSRPVRVNWHGTATFIAPRPRLGTSLYQPHLRVPQSLFRSLLSVSVLTGLIDGYRSLYCTAPLSVPTRTGPTNGYPNLYRTAPARDQPVPSPPASTAINIAPPPPIRVNLYQSYQ